MAIIAGYSTVGSKHTSEYDLRSVLPGDISALRPRLAHALEQLGYRILNEEPLHARRGPHGGGRWGISLNVCDYPTSLTVSLKLWAIV